MARDQENFENLLLKLELNDRSLIRLNLRYQQLTKEDIEQLKKALSSNQIVEMIDLSHNENILDNWGLVLAIIKNMPLLKYLKLSFCNLNDKPVRDLVTHFKDCSTIEKIDLSCNSINLAVAWFAGMMKKHPTLKHLNFENNQIENLGLGLIADHFAENFIIEEILIEGNKSEGIEHTRSLAKIDSVIKRNLFIKEVLALLRDFTKTLYGLTTKKRPDLMSVFTPPTEDEKHKTSHEIDQCKMLQLYQYALPLLGWLRHFQHPGYKLIVKPWLEAGLKIPKEQFAMPGMHILMITANFCQYYNPYAQSCYLKKIAVVRKHFTDKETRAMKRKQLTICPP